MVSQRVVGLFCFQEVIWHGAFAHMIVDKDSCCKIFWIGIDNGNRGVSILLAEELIEEGYMTSAGYLIMND